MAPKCAGWGPRYEDRRVAYWGNHGTRPIAHEIAATFGTNGAAAAA